MVRRLSNFQIETWAKLTKGERACIRAMLEGHYSDKEIARVVGLHPTTVAEYLKGARAKFKVTSRIALVLIAQLVVLREQALSTAAHQKEATILPRPVEKLQRLA